MPIPHEPSNLDLFRLMYELPAGAPAREEAERQWADRCYTFEKRHGAGAGRSMTRRWEYYCMGRADAERPLAPPQNSQERTGTRPRLRLVVNNA